MAQKIKGLVLFFLQDFSPLIIFYGTIHFYGLKPAIAASLVFSLCDIAYRLFRKKKISGLFLFSAALSLVFGLVDLYAKESFLFKYEATATNVLTGIFFGISIFAERSIIQEFAEKQAGEPMAPHAADFFRLVTAIWVLYFFGKAAAYFWVAQKMSLEQGLVVRTILGSGSLYAMMGASIFGSRPALIGLQKVGLFLPKR